MNFNLKLVAAVTCSFIAGYMVANSRNSDYYLNLANDELDEIQKKYDSELEKLQTEVEGYRDGALRDAADAIAAYKEGTPVSALVSVTPTEKIPYSSYSNVQDEQTKPSAAVLEPNQPNIETITPEEFVENNPGYEQYTLVYYRGDDTLTDGTTGEKIIGEFRTNITGRYDDVLFREGFWEGLKANEWYLRHHDLSYDYEVVYAAGKYADEVESPGENE